MGKLPWAKFFYADFTQDTQILSNQATGGWIRILCQMWHKNSGTLSFTKKQLSRLLGADENKSMEIIREIMENKIGNVNITGPNEKITVISRRIKREVTDRENNRLRQERFQSKKNKRNDNGSITGEKSEAKKSEAKKSDLKPINIVEREEIFNSQFWTVYPPRNGKRREKKKALDQFKRIPEKDIPKILLGVRNYQQSKEVLRGYAKDAFRWIRDRSYMDWQTPDEPEPFKETGTQKALREEKERIAREGK